MRLNRTFALAASSVLFVGAAQAQIAINEIHISQTGTDDEEFLELIAAPGTSLDGVMVLVVENDATSPAVGALDRAWDLTGNVVNPSGYFVLGDSSPAVSPDFVTGATNTFENSSATFYVVDVPDPNIRATIDSVWLGSVIANMGTQTTMISTTAGVTILDAVAVTDADLDPAFDNAPNIGPDGTFMPAGIFRTGDCPNDWCSDEFTNFFWDPGAMPPSTPAANDPTPGALNFTSSTCVTVASVGNCGPGGIGTPYCATVANSTGASGVMTASGSASVAANMLTLEGSSLPSGSFAFFLTSLDQGFVANPGGSQGNLCLGGSIGRYVGPGQIQQSSAAGEVSLAIDLTMIPQPTGFVSVMAGDTWNFQCWHRDTVGASATSNFTNGLEVTFN